MLYGFYPIVNANNGCWETQIGQEMLKCGSKMFFIKKKEGKNQMIYFGKFGYESD